MADVDDGAKADQVINEAGKSGAVFQAAMVAAGDARDANGEADHYLWWRFLGPKVAGHLQLFKHSPLDPSILAAQIPRFACVDRRAVRLHLSADSLPLAARQMLGSFSGKLGLATAVELLCDGDSQDSRVARSATFKIFMHCIPYFKLTIYPIGVSSRLLC